MITLVVAVYGALLAIDGMKEWYPSLTKPVDIPLWLFSIVQPIYYVICVTVLYRLISYVEDFKVKRNSVTLFMFMMLFAESWNYFFLGLKSVSLGFWLMLVFSFIAMLVFFNLRKVDRLSSKIFTPYLIWLLVDITWIYGVWEANG